MDAILNFTDGSCVVYCGNDTKSHHFHVRLVNILLLLFLSSFFVYLNVKAVVDKKKCKMKSPLLGMVTVTDNAAANVSLWKIPEQN